MDIMISPEAAEYIKQKSKGHLTIFRGLDSGCCAGSVPAPRLQPGTPPVTVMDGEVKLSGRSSIFFHLDVLAVNTDSR